MLEAQAQQDVLAGADLAPSRLGAAVTERFTRAILEGRLKPGDPLPSEGRIAAAFGVSKQVAREAVRELAAMGVVHIQQGKPSRVRRPNADPLGRFFRFAAGGTAAGLAEAIELRRTLEPPIARFAALRRTAVELAALKGHYARLEAALADVPAWIDADLDFHEELAVMSGNRFLRLQLQGLRPVIRQVMELFNSRQPRSRDDWRATLHRHERVVAAVAAGDGEAARDAMIGHFELAEAAISELFPRVPADAAEIPAIKQGGTP
jgi:GntR family transcriptional regulator, transcriptional repressor for pyruvate dehydrogenase complex